MQPLYNRRRGRRRPGNAHVLAIAYLLIIISAPLLVAAALFGGR